MGGTPTTQLHTPQRTDKPHPGQLRATSYLLLITLIQLRYYNTIKHSTIGAEHLIVKNAEKLTNYLY